MPRLARVQPGGYVYHVINRGNHRMSIFDDDGDYAAFVRVMADTSEQIPMRILAYCLMPNHWHLVLWPRADGDLSRFMQRLTVTHVRRWHAHRHTTGQGHLYQGTYKSLIVSRDEHFLTVCRYVERNALRAGFVKQAQQWPWSSLWQRSQRTSLLPPEAPVLTDWPVDRPRYWVRHVNAVETSQELESLRQSIRRGQPYGNNDWRKRLAKRLGLESTLRPRGRPRKKK